MQQFNSGAEIINFAIEKEEEAQQFYLDLAAKMDRQHMVKVLKGFAAEEAKHATLLKRVKDGRKVLLPESKVPDLNLSDYLVEVEPSADMDYQDALTLAMHKEKAAFKLYKDLAAATEDDGLKETLTALAQEEAKHKLHLEVEYDEYVLSDN